MLHQVTATDSFPKLSAQCVMFGTLSTLFKMHFIYIPLAELWTCESRIVNIGTKSALTQLIVHSKFKLHHKEQGADQAPISLKKLHLLASNLSV